MALDDDPFDFQVTKAGTVRVFRGGREVVTVAGRAAEKLVASLGVDDATDQQLLARVTGNYRRGNERTGRMRR
ncbi:hypothetical protein GCM10023221_01130 [Luteimicrobium xylanilyticum]|uniref:Uncharacterized protein n=1 Tax=Luteimicrobium xylanilyticum TaxID=1133546 RepID=A0A5P9Q8W4_9MICO|nr:hypothetical protein [Luteimicrobium xylanilyticum]QFU97590.1 hypothetical protein KDY119_01089 [Luteimicrobium xylanilyticum]